ncbi:dihydrofolate synthase / folylpolyglutamate synthase [Lachnospiraceae bacterium A10]|nr:dihydrofolate synthase / folylpolyglutamate synthase [Lachnospiraceae bacterium A10]
MNYQEAVTFLENLPVFEPSKVKSGEQIMGLESLRILLERLGNPERKLRCIHVGGTNGKGSTVAFLRQILIEAGFRVGTFQSPAIDHMTEQIRLNGQEVSEEMFARAMTEVRAEVENMTKVRAEDPPVGDTPPSPFEMLVAAAFLCFVETQVDYVILEVGLGGDTDATNVIPTPELAILTPISYDHMDLLGATLAEIATHKAGIIKSGGVVLTCPQEPEVMDVLQARCEEVGAELICAEMPSCGEKQSSAEAPRTREKRNCAETLENQHFDLPGYENLQIALLGTYQTRNAALAVRAAELLNEGNQENLHRIEESHIRKGLLHTRWPARFELIKKNPYVILDGGHNVQGAEVLCESLQYYFPHQKVHFVTGVLADKEYQKMMRLIAPLAEKVYTITPPNPRALSAKDLAAYVRSIGVDAEAFESPEDAVDCALAGDVICIFGSLYFVGKAREYFISMHSPA